MKRPLTAFLLLLLPSISSAAPAVGEWVAIVSPGFQREITPLAEARKKEGWNVTIIPAPADPATAMPQVATLAAQSPSQPVCVLLAGDFGKEKRAGDFTLPASPGTRLRMTGQPTDLPWTICAKGHAIEVGRLPARTADEARAMVKKILDWPAATPPDQPFPIARLLAGYHAAPPQFAKVADNMTNTISLRLLGQLPAAWQLEAAAHIDDSPWQISGKDITATAARMMSSRATLLAYMGHSGPDAAYSKDAALLSAPSWRALPESTPRPGLFFTCGCFSCATGSKDEAYSFAAIRSPGGPPAVIGAQGESWSAMGYLAISGILSRLSTDPPLTRVGEFWRATQLGLEKGDISPVEFAMFDMADGTGGKVPLDQQRLEHLEMWMLLGDPAMPLLPPAPTIKFDTPANPPVPGQPWTITGTLPDKFSAPSLRITFERHPATIPADLPSVPTEGPERQKATRERHRLTTEVILATAEAKPAHGKFSATLTLSTPLPPKPWTLRATAPYTAGILQIK